MTDDIPHTPGHLRINDRLIEEARNAGAHKTKEEAVTAALNEYIQRRKERRFLECLGTFDFDPAYDYKAERSKKRG